MGNWWESRGPFQTDFQVGVTILICACSNFDAEMIEDYGSMNGSYRFLTWGHLRSFNEIIVIVCWCFLVNLMFFQGWSSRIHLIFWAEDEHLFHRKFWHVNWLKTTSPQKGGVHHSSYHAIQTTLITKGSEFSHETEYNPGLWCLAILANLVDRNLPWICHELSSINGFELNLKWFSFP